MGSIVNTSCPECGFRHSVKSPANRIQKHFAVQRNSFGNMEFQLEVPTGQTVDEWVLPDDSLQLRVGGALCLGGLALITYAILAQAIGVPDYPLIVSSLSVFTGFSALSLGWLQVEGSKRIDVAKWLKSQYLSARNPVVEKDQPIRLEVRETRTEAQANQYAYRFINGLDFDNARERFTEWASDVIQPMATVSIREWGGKSKLFTRNEYEKLIEKMEGLGIMYKSEKGWRLTNGGKRSLSAYVNQTTPLPH